MPEEPGWNPKNKGYRDDGACPGQIGRLSFKRALNGLQTPIGRFWDTYSCKLSRPRYQPYKEG